MPLMTAALSQSPAPLIARSRLDALLDGARGRRVAIVGDAMLDVYLRGDVDRISPEAPVPVVRVRSRTLALGGAANVAQNVAAAGASCALVAAVGADDLAGRTLCEELERIQGDSDSLVRVARPTTTKTRVLAAVSAAVSRADALVLEDYNKGVLVPSVIEGAIRVARSRGIPIIVDPKYRNFFSYRGATVFKPNRRELEAAMGAAVDLEHPEALPVTFERLGVEHLLLTLGERGMALIAADGVVRRIPTTARDVYDVVGAGDTVTAYLATSLAAGASAYEAAVVANYAAGVEVGKLGAATVTPDEIREAYEDHHGNRE